MAYFSAVFFDALFKLNGKSGLSFNGMTFYGGMIGGICCMYILLRATKKSTQYSVRQWFDILTLPLIVFHFCGRVGCFLGGCCYGKATDSLFGVQFPDNQAAGIYHGGAKCYPTQLFEAVALIITAAVVMRSREKFTVYLFSYSVFRFLIEFFRGDYRGNAFLGMSPAQMISVIIFLLCIIYKTAFSYKNRADINTDK